VQVDALRLRPVLRTGVRHHDVPVVEVEGGHHVGPRDQIQALEAAEEEPEVVPPERLDQHPLVEGDGGEEPAELAYQAAGPLNDLEREARPGFALPSSHILGPHPTCVGPLLGEAEEREKAYRYPTHARA